MTRTINIRQLQYNLHKELQDCPVTVTRNGVPYVYIIPANNSLPTTSYKVDVTTSGHVTTSNIVTTSPNVTTDVTTPKRVIKTVEDLPTKFKSVLDGHKCLCCLRYDTEIDKFGHWLCPDHK